MHPIGHRGHPEVEGTMETYDTTAGGDIYPLRTRSRLPRWWCATRPAVLCHPDHVSMDDTARVIEALRQRFPENPGPRKDDICYATQNRQDAVKQLAAQCDLVLVVGSPTVRTPTGCGNWLSAWRAAYLLDGRGYRPCSGCRVNRVSG